MPAYPQFIMFEGIDGSGKTTLARFFAELLAQRGKTIFDLPETSKMSGKIPLPWQSKNEIIFTAEPTRSWIGAAIREELIRKGTGYPASLVAEAYAMDRFILYERLLVPMLKKGVNVISDRGLPTSVSYQPIMAGGVSLGQVLSYPGNKLALEHAPGHLIIVKCSAITAIARLSARSSKKDDALFEKEDFLTKASERYESDWFRKLWEDCGTKVHYLNGELPIEAVKTETMRLLNEIHPT